MRARSPPTPETRPGPPVPGTRPGWPPGRLWVAAAVLGLLTLAIFSGVRGNAFLHFDDDQYVTDNPWVRAGLTWRGAAWAFTTLRVSNWHPLAWLSHMLDVQLFGLDPGAHHLVSAVIHAVNAALVLLVLARLTGAPRRSLVAAALFALHPLRVESVAWVAERKDVLSACFGLLMLAAYGAYARRPTARRYLAVVGALAASLLSKPTWVTAPLLLLLLDVWPLRRLGPGAAPDGPRPASPPPLRMVLLEKVPLLALSAGVSTMAVVAQRRGGAMMTLQHVGLAGRISNAVVSYVRYLGMTFWPSPLAALYPLPPHGWPAAAVIACGGLLAAITAAALWNLRRWPWLAVGWCWFLGTLVPVIGLVQVGSQAMADRYTYLPSIGLAVAVVWSAAEAARDRPALRVASGVVAVAIVAALSLVTVRQVRRWSDQETLFRHAVAVTGENPRAQLILSQAIAASGRYLEALGPAREAARLDPMNARARKNLGFILYKAGLVDEAIAELEAAIALDPSYAEAHGNLGIAYGRRGRFAAAARELELEQRLRAGSAEP